MDGWMNEWILILFKNDKRDGWILTFFINDNGWMDKQTNG